jgi:hypothetical protein
VSCQLLTITVRGSYLLGGCIYSLGCLIGVIPMLVFLVCGSDTENADALEKVEVLRYKNIIYIYI